MTTVRINVPHVLIALALGALLYHLYCTKMPSKGKANGGGGR